LTSLAALGWQKYNCFVVGVTIEHMTKMLDGPGTLKEGDKKENITVLSFIEWSK
jgi:hypothetical protein